MPLARLALLAALALAVPAAAQTEVTLAPAADNTLYESDTGALSNGAGAHLFAGRTSGNRLRRALLRFDVAAAVPAGATIESAALELTMNRSIAGATPVAVHRVTAAWGEGSSDASSQEGGGAPAAAGDATWLHAVAPDAFWATPGGDVDPTARATASVEGNGRVTWASTAALVADVQAWLDTPGTNHGWAVLGDESGGTSAKRFASRENGAEADRPALRITFSAGGTATDDGPGGGLSLAVAPNPFAAATTVAFALGAPAEVTLDVVDALGRRVAVLAEGPRAAGAHRVPFAAGALPAGVYLVRLRADDARATRPVVRGR